MSRALVWPLLLALLAGCAADRGAAPALAKSADAAAVTALVPAAAEPSNDAPPAAAPLAFVEMVTAGARAGDALPLIIAVHGLGDRPETFIRLFDGLPFAARVVAPRGPIAHGRGHSWFPVRIPVARNDPRMAAGIGRAAERLEALAGWLTRHRPTIGRPLITGFSQGGIASFAVAVHHPDAVHAAVPIAGALPASLWGGPGPKAPVVALHGVENRVVPFADGAALVEALSARGATARLVRFEGTGHAVPRPMRRALFEALAELAPSTR